MISYGRLAVCARAQSPEFRQNIELEHLKKGDNNNLSLPTHRLHAKSLGAEQPGPLTRPPFAPRLLPRLSPWSIYINIYIYIYIHIHTLCRYIYIYIYLIIIHIINSRSRRCLCSALLPSLVCGAHGQLAQVHRDRTASKFTNSELVCRTSPRSRSAQICDLSSHPRTHYYKTADTSDQSIDRSIKQTNNKANNR